MSEQKKIIITGVNGFVGGHLAKELSDAGYSVHGVGRELQSNESVAPLLERYSQGDLLDKKSVDALDLKAASAIIHLAGLASVAESFDQPERYIADNATMTDNLLFAAEAQGFNGRTVVISTGAIYDALQPMPLSEASPVIETSPYSIGKIAAERTALEHKKNGSDVVIARPFNHIGPGQGLGFLLPDLYKKITEAQAAGEHTIASGTMSNKRDFTDVRDIVRAYRLLATMPYLQHDIYNVSSGNSYSAQDIFDLLNEALNADVEVVVDASKNRPTDANEIIGDSSLLQKELGWSPKVTLKKTIEDFVASQRN